MIALGYKIIVAGYRIAVPWCNGCFKKWQSIRLDFDRYFNAIQTRQSLTAPSTSASSWWWTSRCCSTSIMFASIACGWVESVDWMDWSLSCETETTVNCECGRIRKKKALFGGGIKQNKERRETNFLKFSQVQSIYLPFTVKIVTQEKNVSHSHNFKKITFVIPPILNTLLTAFSTHNFSTQLQISQPLH